MPICPACKGTGVIDNNICDTCEIWLKYGCCIHIENNNPNLCPHNNVCLFCEGYGEIEDWEYEEYIRERDI